MFGKTMSAMSLKSNIYSLLLPVNMAFYNELTMLKAVAEKAFS